MANIQLKITALGDFASVNAQLKALQTQVQTLQKSIAGVGLSTDLTSQLKGIQNEFSNALVSSGNFTKQTVQLTSETEKFGKALQSGKLSLGQYFGIITGRSAEAQKSVQALAVEQVKLNNSIVQQDITKQGVYSVYTPTTINATAKAVELAAAKQNIFNIAVQQGSQKLIDFGKNTQWAGRQLTVGLSMPALLFGSQAVSAFKAVNTELTRLQRLYGEGLTPPSQAQLNQISDQVLKLGAQVASQMGIAQSETTKVAANFAAMGKQGQSLLDVTYQAQRLSKLGAIDATQATNTIVSLQNVYKVSTTDLANAVNFMSSMQKQTTMSLQDMTDAIPRVGPIMAQLGGSYKDTAVMLLAMREAGVPAAQAANALKSAFASIIAPTSAASKEFQSFGINLESIKSAGTPVQMLMSLQTALANIAPLAREQLIEKLFGKFQFARVSALLDNFGKVGSQTQNALKVAGATNAQLATLAGQEMAQATASTTAKWQRAVEGLKASLYPIGQKILEVGSKILEFGQKIADFFNKLPGPIKSGLGILLTLGVIAGPVIMITGLFANLMGQVIKVGYSLLGVIDGSKKWRDLMTPAGIAAKTATDAFQTGLLENVTAVDTLNAALQRLITSLESINMNFSAGTGTSLLGKVEAAAATEVASGQLILPGMATGGYVPGTGNTDSYPAMLTPGEAVIPKSAVAEHGPLINAIISGSLPGYNDGLRANVRQQYGGNFNYLSESGNVRSYADREVAHLDAPIDLPSGASEENAKVAMYHREINQGTNSGMSAKDYLDYLNGQTMSVGNGGRLMPNLKVVDASGNPSSRSITHNQELAYGPMATTAGITDPKQRQSFYDEIDKRIKAWLEPLAKANKQIRDVAGPGQGSATQVGQIVNEVLKQQNYGQAEDAISTLQAPLETRTTGKGRSGRTRRFVGGDTRISGIVAKILAGKNVTKAQEDIVSNSGIIDSGNFAKLDTEARKQLQIESPSKKGESTGKDYVSGLQKGIKEQAPQLWTEGKQTVSELHNGIDEGLNGSAGQSKIQGMFNKAFGANSRLGGMMSKFSGMSMMGRMGVGMGMGMVTQMASPLINKIPGGNLISDAMSGASMGAVFGPWGMAAGAAISLVTGGIKSLMNMEKQHAAESKADFQSSADAVQIMGGQVADTTHIMSVWNDTVIKTKDKAVKPLADGIAYTRDQLNSFTNLLKTLPKDNPLTLVMSQIKGLGQGDAAKVAQEFAKTQMAINGISKSQADSLVQMMLTMSGHNGAGAGVGVADQLSAIKSTLSSLKPDTKQFSDFVGQITNLAVNTDSWDKYKTIIDSIGTSAQNSKNFLDGLIQSLIAAGDYQGANNIGALKGQGFSTRQAVDLLKAQQAGVSVDTTGAKTAGYVALDIADKSNVAGKQTLALENAITAAMKKKNDATVASTNATKAATAAAVADTAALTAKQKLLDANLKSLQDLQKQQTENTNYATTKEDLKNQILMAQATGDNLKAQLLQQQLMGTTRDFNLQNKVNEAQQAVDANRLLLDAANATKNAVVSGTTATVSAIQAAADKISKQGDVKVNAGDSKSSAIDMGDLKSIYSQNPDLKPKAGGVLNPGVDPSQWNTALGKLVGGASARSQIKLLAKERNLQPGQYFSIEHNGLKYTFLVGTDSNIEMIGKPSKISPVSKASGGHISGPGSATSDSIPAMLSNGEYVVNAGAVSHYGKGTFDALNSMHLAKGGVARTNSSITYHRQHMNRIPRHFATGGYVPAAVSSLMSLSSVPHYSAGGSVSNTGGNVVYNVNVNVDKIDSTVDMTKAINDAMAKVEAKAKMSGMMSKVGH